LSLTVTWVKLLAELMETIHAFRDRERFVAIHALRIDSIRSVVDRLQQVLLPHFILFKASSVQEECEECEECEGEQEYEELGTWSGVR